jgi:hypothetical protein
LAGLTYQPIDVQQLQQQATQASIQNATNSLALQRQLQPNVAKSNDELQASVASQLALGGNLGADLSNSVTNSARTSNAASGAQGGSGPATAALLGQSALGLLQSRQNAATQLAAANPAPSVGLSPSDLASATIANNNGLNQFALAKAGASSNLINSQAQSNSATAAGVGSSLSSALSLLALSKGSGGATSTTLQPQTFNTTNPTITAPTAAIGGGSVIGGL